VLVEDAAAEAGLACLGPVFPLLEAHVDLADVEDEFVDSVSELGRQAEEGRELLVAFPSVGGQVVSR
jgi:hypothetical protein